MDNQMAKALKTVRSEEGASEDAYLAACSYLVGHRDALPCRVFIDIPGGLTSNQDPRWDAVRAGSDSCCGCGNERVILPAVQRGEFEASPSGPITVTAEKDKKVYFRPVGGDKTSAYMCVWIEQDAFAFVQDPFSHVLDFNAIFSQPAFPLDKLAAAMVKQEGKPAVMMTGKRKTPVFGITAVDVVAQTVTLVPDKDVEVFDPDAETKPQHGCGV